jgi:hypothetical protein
MEQLRRNRHRRRRDRHVDRLSSRTLRRRQRAAARARHARGGTSAQSSCIVRTHYSVPVNVALAHALAIFEDFPGYLEDAEAECGLNRCG